MSEFASYLRLVGEVFGELSSIPFFSEPVILYRIKNQIKESYELVSMKALIKTYFLHN